MNDSSWYAQQADLTLRRLLPRLEPVLPDPALRLTFTARLGEHFPRLFRLLHGLYGERYDFFYHVEQILLAAARMCKARPADLKALDVRREADPVWFQAEQIVGGVCYVDLFAGDLAGAAGAPAVLPGAGADLPAPHAPL